MRSQSLSTPLTNTPVYYDDQVSSKMALLGKRGFYDPGYIYGFDSDNNIQNQNIPQNSYEYKNDQIDRTRMDEKFQKDEMKNQMRNDIYQNENNIMQRNIKDVNDFYDKKKNYHVQNINEEENDEFKKEYYNYLNNKNNMIKENESNYKMNNNDIALPKTREQIQHEVFIENFRRQQLAKQMMKEEEMKYKQNLFRK